MDKEKKEIGIEKLIELLNEYEDYKEKETEIRNYTRRNVKCDGVERIECLREVDGELFGEDECTAIIICKGYMFIQWLVENDKIDFDKCGFKNEGLSGNWYDKGIAFVSNYDNDTFKISEFYSPYLQLLMLLSISDEPIDFLISILK